MLRNKKEKKTQPTHKRTEILEPFTLFTSFPKVSMSGGNNFQQQPKKINNKFILKSTEKLVVFYFVVFVM